MSQRDQVAHVLRVRGDQGVHSFELRKAYIGNPSERISDLERAGWSIQHKRERGEGGAIGTRYVMLSEPDVDVDRASSPPIAPGGPSECITDRSSAAGPVSTDTLFGMPRVKPALSPYDPMSDAA